MTDVEGSIKAEKVQTDEPTFKPGQKTITAVLTPVEEDEPYIAPITPYVPFTPTFITDKRSCILDIESTGLYPWDSKLICTGVLDVETVTVPDDIAKNTIVFQDQEEALQVKAAIDWLTANGITEFIGYNVAFDYRFIFTKCMRYGLKCPAFVHAQLYDVMQVMEQVKQAFVYGNNRAGSMGQWQEYLFGTTKLLDYEGILKAYKEGRIDVIVEYNKQDIKTIYDMWALINFVSE